MQNAQEAQALWAEAQATKKAQEMQKAQEIQKVQRFGPAGQQQHGQQSSSG